MKSIPISKCYHEMSEGGCMNCMPKCSHGIIHCITIAQKTLDGNNVVEHTCKQCGESWWSSHFFV